MEIEEDPFVMAHAQEHPHREAVVLVLLNEDGELLMVRTRRLPNHWQCLGGGIDADDLSAERAAAREVKEETGIEIRPEDMIHLCEAPYDFGIGTVHFFSARLQEIKPISIDESEIAEASWRPLREALTLPMFSAMRHALLSLCSRIDLM